MSSVDPTQFGDATDHAGSLVPTWRDLPLEPPYGPVTAPRTANIRGVFAPTVVEDDPTISAGQIALAVGGTLLLVAIGIGAALFLLRDDDVVTLDPPPPAPAPADPQDDGPAPQPPPPPPTTDSAPATPAPSGGQSDNGPDDSDSSSGDSAQGPTPVPDADDPAADPGAGDPTDPGTQDPTDPGADPDGGGPGTPSQAPSPPGQPDPNPAPPDPGAVEPPAEDGADLDLPRLFTLRTLPTGVTEESTTMRQTTRTQQIVAEEQTTLLQTETTDEVTVQATRAPDAADRLDTFLTDGAEEVNIRGLQGFLLPSSGQDQRLVYLAPGPVDTLIQITVPQPLGTEEVLTIAQGLELLR